MAIGDITAISGFAEKVYTAYKEAPNEYRHISEEVRSLQVIIDKALGHFESDSLRNNDWQEGLEVLNGCQSVLEDLYSLMEKYNTLAAANASQVFEEVKLDTEDIATLELRLISNTDQLEGFIQRFDILTITIENLC